MCWRMAARRRGRRLAEERQDRDAGVAADDGHVDVLEVEPLFLGDEGVGAHDVERRHADQAALVVHARLFEHLGRDRHRAVDRVADDLQHGLFEGVVCGRGRGGALRAARGQHESWRRARAFASATRQARHTRTPPPQTHTHPATHTLGHALAAASTRPLTMPALMLNRSSRVMPGLRGTPAGMMTRSQPLSAASSSSGPWWPVTCCCFVCAHA